MTGRVWTAGPPRTLGRMADETRIEDHAVVGDLHSVALVSTDGAIDWACLPRFDSPAVFTRLLDPDDGGAFTVEPDASDRTRQLYLPDSNVLMTRFHRPDSVSEVVDFMVPNAPGVPEEGGRPLVRRLRTVRGEQTFSVRCRPAFDWGRAPHEVELAGGGAVFRSAAGTLTLRCTHPLEADGPAAVGRITLQAGETADLLLRWTDDAACEPVADGEAERLQTATVTFWQEWIGRSTYTGRWRETVNRGALLLKLLVYAPTGALVASPTAGLPEGIGGERNWDYRYTWLRDAAFTTYALMRLGFTDEASAFMDWLQQRMADAEPDTGLLPMYTLDGDPPPAEEVLDHLPGHRGSTPVRSGNAAGEQLQLDTYGEVLDSVYLFNKHAPISYDLWSQVRSCLAWLAEHWREPDHGLWEKRGEPREHTFSRVMVWVAFERALRLARQRGLPAPMDEWAKLAGEAYESVQEAGWDDELEAFVDFPGSGRMDASLLIMPLVKFTGPTDPRFTSTLARIEERLVLDSLVRRYEPDGEDGLDAGEGTFTLCSFWYVEALTRAGRLREARDTLEKAFTYANHVGLYAEELGTSGEHLGNFPQALTHLALISAVVNLDKQLG